MPRFRPILWEQCCSGRRDQRSKRWEDRCLSLDRRRKQDQRLGTCSGVPAETWALPKMPEGTLWKAVGQGHPGCGPLGGPSISLGLLYVVLKGRTNDLSLPLRTRGANQEQVDWWVRSWFGEVLCLSPTLGLAWLCLPFSPMSVQLSRRLGELCLTREG